MSVGIVYSAVADLEIMVLYGSTSKWFKVGLAASGIFMNNRKEEYLRSQAYIGMRSKR